MDMLGLIIICCLGLVTTTTTHNYFHIQIYEVYYNSLLKYNSGRQQGNTVRQTGDYLFVSK